MNTRLHDLLTKSVKEHADRVAIVDRGHETTYAALGQATSALAYELQCLNLRQGSVVGNYLRKSVEAIVSQFAALEAGIAFAPLDARHWPPRRIAGLVARGQLNHIISTQELWHELLDTSDASEREILEKLRPTFVDDVMVLGVNDTASRQRMGAPTSEDMACVFFTSGSTGAPKGVMISHANALSFVEWATAYFGPSAGTRFASHASLNFDLSVFDVFVSIASGGELHLVPSELAINPRALVRWIASNKIAIWYSVPSAWLAMLKHGKLESRHLISLQKILFAGEVFPSAQLADLMNLQPGASYFNLYGPTETNVCTVYEVKATVDGAAVPIGSACPHCEVYAVDENFELVDQGEIGELVVCGPNVAMGYFHDNEETQRAFVKNPSTEHKNKLFYRTGDYARQNPDGAFEFVGRKDTLVNISGYRVELLEIENVLNNHFSQSIVVPYVDADSVQCLGALIVIEPAQGSASPSDNFDRLKLLKSCKEILPSYMIPDAIFVVDQLPQNLNGKVDRLRSSSLFSSLLTCSS